jgi:two-component system sensor histidine kinase GlrK
MPRLSFRQLLLLAFVLQAVLLGTVALRGQFTLERLLERSRDGAARTQRLSGHAERLNEETRTMERAARQYLVLGDGALRSTHDRAAAEATAHVQALAEAGLAPALLAQWQAQRDAVARELAGSGAIALRDRNLVQAFRELDGLQDEMAQAVRRFTEARNAELQAELEAGRAAVGRLLVGALVLALLIALALALALARPLRRVEDAIVALGENRFDERIDIRGPADVRQIGRRLDALRQRLAALDADKARFLRHVSHELKTPLAALHEGVALLHDGVAGPLQGRQGEVVHILRDNTATLQHRIEDLLRFNAAAFAAQRLVRKPTELGALLAGLVAEQQLLWQGRGLQVQVSGGPLTADVDAALLGSALGNLLVNAIRFSPPGGQIEITLAREGTDSLRIELADQGPGVAEADRQRIFEPFFRGQRQPEDGLPGTGIGLSIVAETVAAHGGQVILAPGERGARFCIMLPHALVD